jgi:phospholipid-binding lipoprotein MlaA
MRTRLTGTGVAIRTTIVILALAIAGCAAKNSTEQDPVNDPIEPFNRGVYTFNDYADQWILRPIAKGYVWITPSVLRTGVTNFLDNIFYPVDIVNALLQAKFGQALSDTARFGMNTTLGFAGILDPATDAGLEKHNEDFGQTMGVWGIPEGPYLMVPFFGPRTVRSGVGDIADLFVSPLIALDESRVRWGLFALLTIQTRSTLLSVDENVRNAFDPYAFVRDSYMQNRKFLLYDGNLPEEDLYFDDEDFDDEEFE